MSDKARLNFDDPREVRAMCLDRAVHLVAQGFSTKDRGHVAVLDAAMEFEDFVVNGRNIEVKQEQDTDKTWPPKDLETKEETDEDGMPV